MLTWNTLTSTFWLLTTASTFSMACDLVDPTVPTDPDPSSSSHSEELENRTFYSQHVTENEIDRVLVPETRLSISFGENDNLRASAGCNSFSANYKIVDGTLEIEHQGTTEIGCENELHKQEEWYFDFLGQQPLVELKEHTLMLRTETTTIEYLDKEIVTPDLDLIGHQWVVDSIIEGELVMAAEWDPPAWIQWTQDNRIVLFTGCNDGEGQYSILDDQLHFSMVTHTEKGCADMISTKLESAVQKILLHPGPVDFEIDADRLALSIEGYGLHLRAQTQDE